MKPTCVAVVAGAVAAAGLAAAGTPATQPPLTTRCDSATPPKITLSVGDSAMRTIIGYRNPNRTGLLVVHDGEYVLTTTGAWQDGPHVPPTDANGTPNDRLPTAARIFLWSFQRLRPVSKANWLALVGKIDAPGQEHFLIGVGPSRLRAAADGELLALANDVLHYSNNRGCVILTVRRTK